MLICADYAHLYSHLTCNWKWLVETVGHSAGGANMTLAGKIARRHKAGGIYVMLTKTVY